MKRITIFVCAALLVGLFGCNQTPPGAELEPATKSNANNASHLQTDGKTDSSDGGAVSTDN